MEKQEQQGMVEVVADKIWKFFSSVKLAVVLLIILAVVSVIGTVIQQNQAPEEYLKEYSLTTIQLFENLGFFDLYHTWWFVLLLLLFTANLTICTLERFPYAWKAMRAPLKPLEDDGFKAVPFKKEIVVKGGMEAAETTALKALHGKRYSHQLTKEQGMTHLAAQKGAYSRMGVYVTHLSIILIFVGALIGAFFGFKGFLNLPEGEASSVVYLRNEPLWDQIMDGFGISKSPVIHDPRGGVPAMPLGFYVRTDDFEVDYYANAGRPTGMPSEFWSLLSVYDLRQQKVLEKRIRVNDPLTRNGITFYQSSYGTIPNAVGKIVLNVNQKNSPGPGETIVVMPGSSVYVKSIDRTIKAVGMAPFGMRDPATGQVQYYQARNEELINPTVELEVYRGKSLAYRTQVMKVDSGEPSMPENYRISYIDYWGARYTGLQVTKDPGVWIVYAGFILLCVGPLVAFFGSHRKLWVRIQERKGQAAVLVGGSSNRNRIAFEREFNSIVETIAK
ncbi:MAG: cytochrome c biogenesis protein ResB [Nitrospirota bacterium]